MEDLARDIQYSIRVLLKRPGYTFVLVLTFALGIGINSAIFSIVYAVLLQPLPYNQPGSLVQIWEAQPEKGINKFAVTPSNYLDWSKEQQVFDDMAAFRQQYFTLTGSNEPIRILAAAISTNLFSTLGVSPALGRDFTFEEDMPANNQVVVVSNEFWHKHFGGDPNLINQVLTLDGSAYTVVGIMPSGFAFPIQDIKTALWVPIAFRPVELDRGPHNISVIARLKQGRSIEQARADMEAIANRPGPQNPEGFTTTVLALHKEAVSKIESSLLMLFGAVCFLLLIACANGANLLLVKAVSRQHEIALRMTLGGSRVRIIKQLLTESVLLAGFSGIVGLLVALFGIRFLVSISPGNVPRLSEAHINGQVLAFTFLVSFLTGIISGIIPALQTSKINLIKPLKEGNVSVFVSGRRKLRRGLMAAEVVLAVVLLAGAGLMINSLIRLQNVDSGINVKNLLTMEVSLPVSKYSGIQQQIDFYRQVLERFRTVPEVQATGVVSNLPLSGGAITESFSTTGVASDPHDTFEVGSYVTSPDYFNTMGIGFLRGRDFEDQDSETSPKVVIINEIMANRFWSGQDPIGKRVIVGGRVSREIIGVAKDAKRFGLDSEAQPEMYIPYAQARSLRFGKLVVRTASNPMNIVSALRNQILAVDKDQATYNIRKMDQLVLESIAQRRFIMLLLSIFASLALVLAVIGIYGVVTYSVSLQTRDIGIRMALGAQPRDVVRLVVREEMVSIIAGTLIGLILGLLFTRVLSSLLYGVSATDPVTYLIITLLLIGIAFLACYIPARKAAKVDPVLALRYD